MSRIHRVGVIGGGQLAWMLTNAAATLGLEVVVQTPHTTDPAAQHRSPEQVVLGEVADAAATVQLAGRCEIITFENEFVDIPALRRLEAQGVCFRPGLSVLDAVLDKYEQRCWMQRLGIPVPAFAALTPQDDVGALGFQFPVVVKARRHGYDGQGTFIVRDGEALRQFWQRVHGLPDCDTRFMVEAFVPFERELAIMAARGVSGEIALYPVVETAQQQQVCRWAIAPALLPATLQYSVERLATQLLETLEVIGILGIELFLTAEGTVLVNEIAPRTHNSGHLTLDACLTSQFEQQLRAVSGLPLGNTALQTPAAVMVNLLGFETALSDYGDQRQRLAELPQSKVHWYGKAASKPGRKLGHVTVLLDSADRTAAVAIAQQVESLWYPTEE